MKNRKIGFRVECNGGGGFGKRRSGYQVVQVATEAIFFYGRQVLADIIGNILVRGKNIVQVKSRHDAENEKHQHGAGGESAYDWVFLHYQKIVT